MTQPARLTLESNKNEAAFYPKNSPLRSVVSNMKNSSICSPVRPLWRRTAGGFPVQSLLRISERSSLLVSTAATRGVPRVAVPNGVIVRDNTPVVPS